ncbi:hypothetical protein Xoosp13_372 [Xanthomonas phage Xoo-sp13]|nr:hypothetical protein Xoosp13_372 [Xanthomonas phage Xoo-sp13]
MPVTYSYPIHYLRMGRDLDEAVSSNLENFHDVEDIYPEVESNIMYRGWTGVKDSEFGIKDKIVIRDVISTSSDVFLSKFCRFKRV